MSKTAFVLAIVATFGLGTMALADTAPSTTKERVQHAHSQASVTHKKRLGHRAGTTKYAVANHHNRHHQVRHASHQAGGKKSLPKHATANKKMRAKASS